MATGLHREHRTLFSSCLLSRKKSWWIFELWPESRSAFTIASLKHKRTQEKGSFSYDETAKTPRKRNEIFWTFKNPLMLYECIKINCRVNNSWDIPETHSQIRMKISFFQPLGTHHVVFIAWSKAACDYSPNPISAYTTCSGVFFLTNK